MRKTARVKIRKGWNPRVALGFVAVFVVVGTILLISSQAATPTTAVELENGSLTAPATKVSDGNASGGSAVKFGVQPVGPSCTISAILVNSCRPWIGAAVNNYPQVATDKASQIAFADKRLNSANALNNPSAAVTLTYKHDILHTYHTNGQSTFDAAEQAYVNSSSAYLLLNWKPALVWADAGGGNATVNGYIDAMANTFNANRSHKIFLSIYHEPENDVSVGNCTTNAKDAAAGSPTDYVNMWHNVRARFDAKGVTNAIWVMNYMGYSGWDCLLKPMWPGNSYVDWVNWDNYGQGTNLFNTSVNHFYNKLLTNSDATYNFTSKPWGLSEYGYGNANGNSTQANATNYWNDAKTTFNANTYPRLKMYVVFDTTINGNSCVGLLFCNTSTIDTNSQTAYNGFMQTILNSDN